MVGIVDEYRSADPLENEQAARRCADDSKAIDQSANVTERASPAEDSHGNRGGRTNLFGQFQVIACPDAIAVNGVIFNGSQKLLVASLIGMPIREDIGIKVYAVVTYAILVEADARVCGVHDAATTTLVALLPRGIKRVRSRRGAPRALRGYLRYLLWRLHAHEKWVLDRLLAAIFLTEAQKVA